MAARMPYPRNTGKPNAFVPPVIPPVVIPTKTRDERQTELLRLDLLGLISIVLSLNLSVPLVPTINGLINMILNAEGY